LFKRLKPTR